ncbi:branched-chain amino acid ABC transporter substrate-binding protein [Pseudofrankia asymbiotica]|uniref:Branched chain amino acid ABC transporter substrate-binding protein n=1 Tax=Pseudofrankia asymbiotica TaxID=1834516 RepID=A0A1V2I5K6_9ACTN|nr:branched-chain amino acid ABC transporter substrate-binding protein [Pseudofrankia asymbiotica]ONH26141.1 branched chain amino acid ABC transporter substrate-binding protein [Pseudofrankia asymbiotica]
MVRRRLLGALALATAVSLTAAACGSDDGDSNGGSGDGKPSYTIGFQGPLSGDNQQLGINGEDGFKLAIDEANKKGDLPFTLKTVSSDDVGSPDQAPAAAAKLVGNDDVIAIVGPMFSGATKASEQAFAAANLLSVSPSATNPDLTNPSNGFTTFFRVIPTDDVQGKAAADYISKALKPAKVYSVDDASEYGTGLSKVIEAELKANGTALVHESVNPTKDYTSEATKLVAEKPDVIYYSGYYAEFALLTKALKDKGYAGKILSGDGSLDPQFVEQAGSAAAEGALISCPCLWAQADPNAAGFVSAYKALNKQDPGTYSAEAYDAANAIIETLKKLGPGADRAAVANAFKTTDYKGLTKQIKFTDKGEVNDQAVFIYTVKNGEIALVGPVSKLVPTS